MTLSATRLFFLGASLAALANIGFALAGDFLGAIPFRALTGFGLAGHAPHAPPLEDDVQLQLNNEHVRLQQQLARQAQPEA